MQVIGYTIKSETWCANCARDVYEGDLDNTGAEIGAIFSDTEFDFVQNCVNCDEVIECVSLQRNAYREALDKLSDEVEDLLRQVNDHQDELDNDQNTNEEQWISEFFDYVPSIKDLIQKVENNLPGNWQG